MFSTTLMLLFGSFCKDEKTPEDILLGMHGDKHCRAADPKKTNEKELQAVAVTDLQTCLVTASAN